MFSFMIVVNDNGELKSVTNDELDACAANLLDSAGRPSLVPSALTDMLQGILDARAFSWAEVNETVSSD